MQLSLLRKYPVSEKLLEHCGIAGHGLTQRYADYIAIEAKTRLLRLHDDKPFQKIASTW